MWYYISIISLIIQGEIIALTPRGKNTIQGVSHIDFLHVGEYNLKAWTDLSNSAVSGKIAF